MGVLWFQSKTEIFHGGLTFPEPEGCPVTDWEEGLARRLVAFSDLRSSSRRDFLVGRGVIRGRTFQIP